MVLRSRDKVDTYFGTEGVLELLQMSELKSESVERRDFIGKNNGEQNLHKPSAYVVPLVQC